MIPPGADPERYAGSMVRTLLEALTYGPSRFNTIPVYLRDVIEDNLWQRRYCSQFCQRFEFEQFRAFVEAPVPDGLGHTVEQLKHYCRMADDLATLDLIDQALQRPAGASVGNNNAAKVDEKLQTTVDIVNSCFPAEPLTTKTRRPVRPTGNSAEQALRRLRKERPELHARVLAQEVTPHAAMVAAGYRQRTLAVPVTPAGFAAAIRRHLDAAGVQQVIELLQAALP